MQRSLSLALALGLTILAPRVLAGQETPTFADLAWGTSRETAKETLVAKGYSFVKEDSDHDLEFRNAILGQSAVVYLMFGAGGELVKAYVVLATPDEQARGVYQEMVGILSKKYGEPSRRVENYEAPYHKGDGLEDQAIKLGKASLATVWSPDPEENYGIVCGVTNELAVGVSYESRAWHAEYQRRSRAAARDF